MPAKIILIFLSCVVFIIFSKLFLVSLGWIPLSISFAPRPKIESSVLCFTPRNNFFEIKNPKNIEIVSRVFFNHRRKMLKKPFNKLFNGDLKILDKLKIDLNLRPHNLNLETYYKLVIEYENLRS